MLDRRFHRFWFATALVLLFLPTRAAGQGIEPGEVRPELPAPAPAPAEDPRRLRPPLPAPPAGATPLGVELVVEVKRFEIRGSTVFDDAELAEAVAPWVGRANTTEDLLAARDAVTDLYVDRGYVTSGATLPDQDLAGGVVRIELVEGAISEIDVSGNDRFASRYFESRLARVAAAPVSVPEIEKTLRRLQRDPWIERVDALLEPGDGLGRSRLRLVVTEAAQWNVHLQGSNRRSPTVGSGSGVTEGRIANLIGLRDVWTTRFEATKGLRDVELRAEMPVTRWDARLRFRFRDTRTRIVEEPFDELDIEAKARTYGLSLLQPVYRGESDEVWIELTGEHRSAKSKVLGEAFCFEVVGSNCDEATVAVLRVGGEWTRRTRSHVIALRSLVNIGLDVMDATVASDSQHPDGEFVSWIGQAQWAHVLPEFLLGSQFIFRADAQLTNDPLLSIEKIGVGGHQTVRGYRQNQLVRDNGVIVSGELRIPIWRDSLRQPRLELVPFMDYGRAWNIGYEPPQKTLWSVGAGLRFMPLPGMLGEFYWGGRLKDVPDPGDSLQDHGIYMSFSIDAPAIF